MYKTGAENQKSQELLRVIREVTESFIERLPVEIDLLDQLLQELETGRIPPRPIDVCASAHKIFGIARTLGLSELGSAAEIVEEVTSEDHWGHADFDLRHATSCIDLLIVEMEAALQGRAQEAVRST